MRKPDEIALWAALRAAGERRGEFAEVIGERIGIHPKRTWALLYKWAGKGWWSYGVSVRTGWFEPGAPLVLTP